MWNNKGGEPLRYSEEDKARSDLNRSTPVRDQQQLDAIAALTQISTGVPTSMLPPSLDTHKNSVGVGPSRYSNDDKEHTGEYFKKLPGTQASLEHISAGIAHPTSMIPLSHYSGRISDHHPKVDNQKSLEQISESGKLSSGMLLAEPRARQYSDTSSHHSAASSSGTEPSYGRPPSYQSAPVHHSFAHNSSGYQLSQFDPINAVYRASIPSTSSSYIDPRHFEDYSRVAQQPPLATFQLPNAERLQHQYTSSPAPRYQQEASYAPPASFPIIERHNSESSTNRIQGVEKIDDHGHRSTWTNVSKVASTTQIPIEPVAPRGKPEVMKKALGAADMKEQSTEQVAQPDDSLSSLAAAAPETIKKKKSPKKTTIAVVVKKGRESATKPSKNRTKSTNVSSSLLTNSPMARGELLLNEDTPFISDAEYENLEELMTQFCRVPLLAEFSRPVSLLHPEISSMYSKIVSHPVDLGHVCRGVRRRQYQCLRDVRLDMWRVFANCVKYNSHTNNKEAVPSFVSIALHLRDYFNNLWQEFMIPSELPSPPPAHDANDSTRAAFEVLKNAYSTRESGRKKRLDNSGVLVLSNTFSEKMAARLATFVETGGLVDKLDTKPLFKSKPGEQDEEIDLVVQRLRHYHLQMLEVVKTPNVEYTVDAFYTDLRKCYTEDVLEDNPVMRNRFCKRLDRLFWKYAIPLHEANSRGVTQSSIWGNIAAVIWARESSKKPYWPAICLGILPPPAQREGWHAAVTQRNENRLPERLRSQLKIAKHRCEQAQKRQSMSYFLVEFLGTHEFIWVRETDIIENFDPEDDPNKATLKSGKKHRSVRTSTSNVVGSQMYATALQECVWANEEYENVLQDAFEFADDNEDEGDGNLSFALLAQSDDEAEHNDEHGYKYEENEMSLSDVDEANWLLSHEGTLDLSVDGRKNSKKRQQAMKKATSAFKKDASAKDSIIPKKRKGTSSAKTRKESSSLENRSECSKENKKEEKDLDSRRRKRSREREKALRSEAKKKAKRRRPDESDDNEHFLKHDKRARASAIVKAYLLRWSQEDDSRSLAYNSVMTLPASMVDSTGLLGIALAFRTASGMLSMPDDGEEQHAKTMPWAVIDSITPKTSAERVTNLEKQIKLLEKEINRVKADAEKRRLLASEYDSKRQGTQHQIEEDNRIARQNPFKKRKKVSVASTKSDSSPTEKDTIVDVEYDENATQDDSEILNGVVVDKQSETPIVLTTE